MAEIFFSKSSLTFNPDKVPLSYAPIIRYPFFLELGKSFEKAHIASWNLSISPVETVRSILYVSVLVNSSRTSSFDIMLFLLLIIYQTFYHRVLITCSICSPSEMVYPCLRNTTRLNVSEMKKIGESDLFESFMFSDIS